MGFTKAMTGVEVTADTGARIDTQTNMKPTVNEVTGVQDRSVDLTASRSFH